MMLQVVGGIVLMVLLVWQVVVGFQWIKLGKSHFKIHRWTGVAIMVLTIPHLINGLELAGLLKG